MFRIETGLTIGIGFAIAIGIGRGAALVWI
jgi:hypothetical protein